MKLRIVFWLCFSGFLLQAKYSTAQNLDSIFEQIKLKDEGVCGVKIWDIEAQKNVFAYQADKTFVPASNTKIFTFYAALKLLSVSIPALRYVERGDSLIFWGTGNPAFLHSYLQGNKAFIFLKQSGKQLFLGSRRYLGSFFGKGWMWDDYQDQYQPEISEFPIFDNLIQLHWDGKKIAFSPHIDDIHWEISASDLQRNYNENRFYLPKNKSLKNQYSPYKISENTVVKSLQDTLGLNIKKIDMEMPSNAARLYENIPRDTVLKFMMQESDNFTAEQIHLMICDVLNLPLKTENSLDYILKNLMQDLPQKPEWTDGSGLSRYNLISPEDLVWVLNQMYALYPQKENLFQLLSIGGKAGTLKKLFTLDDKPYVYGKTGTLTGVACISGYLRCKSGKMLTFSIMTNNHTAKAAQIRTKMEQFLNAVYEQY